MALMFAIRVQRPWVHSCLALLASFLMYRWGDAICGALVHFGCYHHRDMYVYVGS